MEPKFYFISVNDSYLPKYYFYCDNWILGRANQSHSYFVIKQENIRTV